MLLQKQILIMCRESADKALLLLSYANYMQMLKQLSIQHPTQIDVDILTPIFTYYLLQIKPQANNYSQQQLIDIINSSETSTEIDLLIVSETDERFYFGIQTSNESIDIAHLCTKIKSTVLQFFDDEFNIQLKQFDTSPYVEICDEIINLKIAPGNPPKIYKFLAILSLLDYAQDMNCIDSCFNQLIPIELLLPYYRLYLNTEQFEDIIDNKNIKNKTDKILLMHMRSLPYRKLCTNSRIFFNNDKNPKSRKTANLPTDFGISLSSNANAMFAFMSIRQICFLTIEVRTKYILNTNIIANMSLEVDQKNTITATGRKGQSQYRKSLLERYNYTCALCQLDMENILYASHAKPWSKCVTVHEKLSPNNGLLLCAFHDKLFDKGLITIDIDNDYKLKKSRLISDNVGSQLDLHLDNKVKEFVLTNKKMDKYLLYHKHHIFKR